MYINNQVIDSKVTTPEEARKLLANVSEYGFSDNIRDLAFALGRPLDEIRDILNYDEEVDGDLLMRIHRLAREFDLETG